MHRLMGELPAGNIDFLGILYDDYADFSLLFPGYHGQNRFTGIGTGGPFSIGIDKQTTDKFLREMFGLLRKQEDKHRGPDTHIRIDGVSRAIIHPAHSEEFIEAAIKYGYVLDPVPDALQLQISFPSSSF